MTRQEREDRSRLLCLARLHIRRGTCTSLCHALWIAGKQLELTPLAARVREEIMQSIAPYAFVGTWLMRRHYISESLLTAENLSLYRLRWVSHMIEELKRGQG